ncbi:glycosyltransferase [Ligilactobacillus agilis]|uniref:glycosyltransferase n=1 Tax=Ligilactobacillus agilis TaxID=1601 RepID=UPI003D800237
MSDEYQAGLDALQAGKVQLAKELFAASDDERASGELAKLATRQKDQLISACLITKNNQRTLAECLASLYRYNFEIVIADTGSTDKTVEIARQFTDKVYHFDWVNDFAAARNFAASKASFDYILTLDSDERLVGGSKEELQDFFINTDTKKTVGLYKVVNILSSGKKQNQVINNVIRVYDRRYCKYYYRIHEQVGLIADESALLDTKVLKFRTIHYGYQDEKLLQKKSQRNVELLLAQLAVTPDHVYFIYQLAKSYYILKNYQQSFEYFAKFFLMQKNYRLQWVRDGIDAYLKLCIKTKRYDKALECVNLCQEQCQDSFDMLCIFATVYVVTDDDEQAIRALKKALTLASPDKGEFGWTTADACKDLAKIYERQGRWVLAKEMLTKVGDEKLKLNLDQQLTVVVLVDEETTKLTACLQSLAVLRANYLILVRGANPQTITLARQYSQAVYHFSGQEDELGNYCLTKLTTDYGLIVHANEKLLGADPDVLKQITSKKAAIVGRVRIKVPVKGDEFGRQTHELRLLVKSYSKFNGPNLTDISSRKPRQLLKQVELPLILAKNLTYEAYYQSEVAKQTRLKASLKQKPNPTASFELAESYYHFENYKAASQAYLDFLSGPLELAKEETLTAVTNLISALIEVKDYQGAFNIVITFNPYYQGLSDFQFAAGLAYMNIGQFADALTAFENARKLANSDSLGINTYLSYYQQGVIHEAMGNKQQALGDYRLAGKYELAKAGVERLLRKK